MQPPFTCELDTIKDVRWLAVMDSKVALFGTRTSVEDELERYLVQSDAEPLLMLKVSRLHNDNVTWSVLGTFEVDNQLEQVFASLDPVLASLIHDRKSFQFGVRYSKKVELEYDAIVPSASPAQSISNFSGQSLVAGNGNGSSYTSPEPRWGAWRSQVSIAEYKAWLAECAQPRPQKWKLTSTRVEGRSISSWRIDYDCRTFDLFEIPGGNPCPCRRIRSAQLSSTLDNFDPVCRNPDVLSRNRRS